MEKVFEGRTSYAEPEAVLIMAVIDCALQDIASWRTQNTTARRFPRLAHDRHKSAMTFFESPAYAYYRHYLQVKYPDWVLPKLPHGVKDENIKDDENIE